MKRITFILLAAAAGTLVMQQSLAQKAKPKYTKLPTAKAAPMAQADVVLGHTSLKGGTISKELFDSVAVDGVRTAAAGGRVEGFTFTYGERMLYEDSVGNPLPKTDYLTEYCFGDSLSRGIRENVFSRTKAGDTVYYDDIKVKLPSGDAARGKSMKFVLTR